MPTINHNNCSHPRTPQARAACRRQAANFDADLRGETSATQRAQDARDALAQALTETPELLGARSRAKTNEYRARQMKAQGMPAWQIRVKLFYCPRCESYRYDDAVTGPDVDAMCGPEYCHYAISN